MCLATSKLTISEAFYPSCLKQQCLSVLCQLHLLQVPEAHPSAIFVREKALVIHLESIRMVIAKDAVYILTVPSAMDRQVGVLPTPDAVLVKDLMLRLSTAVETADKLPAAR